jgi:hypothetical protein
VASLRRGWVAIVVACATGGLAMPIAATPVLLAGTSCAGNDCQGDVQTFAKCGGELAGGDPDVWESGPVTGTYLDFHGERTWVFNPIGWMGSREPYGYEAYLSLDPNPDPDGGGFSNPAGNLAEYTVTAVSGGYQVSVLNDTCAQYYLRLVLQYAPAKTGSSSDAVCASQGDAGG